MFTGEAKPEKAKDDPAWKLFRDIHGMNQKETGEYFQRLANAATGVKNNLFGLSFAQEQTGTMPPEASTPPGSGTGEEEKPAPAREDLIEEKQSRIRAEWARVLRELRERESLLSEGDSQAVGSVLHKLGASIMDIPKILSKTRADIRRHERMYDDNEGKTFREIDRRVNGKDGTVWDLIYDKESQAEQAAWRKENAEWRKMDRAAKRMDPGLFQRSPLNWTRELAARNALFKNLDDPQKFNAWKQAFERAADASGFDPDRQRAFIRDVEQRRNAARAAAKPKQPAPPDKPAAEARVDFDREPNAAGLDALERGELTDKDLDDVLWAEDLSDPDVIMRPDLLSP
jgi:hypothetical protein